VHREPQSAGVDTTASGLGFAVHDFARFPDQWQLVRDDPSLARNAFEETIRFESPVIGFFRTTTTEVTLADARIPAQSKVLGAEPLSTASSDCGATTTSTGSAVAATRLY
jgi:cytochrome P450